MTELTLDCATSGSSGEGRGHLRIDVDGTLDSTACTPALKLAKTHTLGNHRITLSLRNPDDSALSPAVEVSVNVTIVQLPVPARRRPR
jgi:hypothetical protein